MKGVTFDDWKEEVEGRVTNILNVHRSCVRTRC